MAASILTATYSILRDGVPYRDLGAAHFPRCDEAQIIRGPFRRLHHLGCDVESKRAA